MSHRDDDTYEPGPIDDSVLSFQSEHLSQRIWEGEEPKHLRLRTNFKSYWDIVKVHPLPPDVLTAVMDSGLYGVFRIGSFRHDAGLITAFVERWRRETHTFHLPFGETTITLQDVHYILGLPTAGHAVIHDFGSPTEEQLRGMINDILGVVPEGNGWHKNGLKISWMVEQFATCDRLDMDSPDYEMQRLFHIRGHLLLIIGSLFPNSSGNTIPFHLLYYVREPSEVGTYSWGSAALAYLYHNLCLSCTVTKKGTKKELCGSMTLLQVWIYEHFPCLAPKLKEPSSYLFPLAMRWKVPRSNTSTTTNRARHGRYELDAMHIDQICWRPYTHFPTDDLPSVMERRKWAAQCPLIFHSIVEWCYPDRVTRQFGFVQDIPNRSPHPQHDTSHEYVGYAAYSENTASMRQYTILSWQNRGADALSPPSYQPARSNERVRGYDTWFQSITRRAVVDVKKWREQDGFQGSRSFHGGGSSSRSGSRNARPVMPESGTYSELAEGGFVAGEGWEHWQRATFEEQFSHMGGGGGWDSMGGGSAQHFSQMGGGGGSSQHASHITYAGGSQSQFHTPQDHEFREFAPVSSSSEEEHHEQPQQREQPDRAVKGKGRRCFTGTHIIFGKKH